jgi:EAL domain-containing protein (putative c-di-GMP-specific phosphodiesterase class I)
LRYTRPQRHAFAVLTLASTGLVAGLVSTGVPRFWFVVYAAVLPVLFRLLILASDRADPSRIPTAMRVVHAMRHCRITLHYQPKIDLRTGEMVAGEALARLETTSGQTLPPAEWIDATSLPWIEWRFCRYVLETGIEQAAAWRQDGLPVVVCLNVSPCNFVDRRLPSTVSDLVRQYGLPPEAIFLELTESALDLSEDATRVANELKQTGVRLAIDDFGVGHSSMSRLARLPIDELKIDRQFIRDIVRSKRYQAIVAATAEMATRLGMLSVAEGIESTDQLELVRDLGCDLAQGYLLGRPVPASEFASRRVSQATKPRRAAAALAR